MGRFAPLSGQRIRIGFPGFTLRVAFAGSRLGIRASCTSPNCRLAPILDGEPRDIVRMPAGSSEVLVAADLPPGEHQADIVRLNEYWQGVMTVDGFLLDPNAHLLPAKAFSSRKLLFIGDSVTCGEGVDRSTGEKATSSHAYGSFGMRLARTLDAQCHLVCFGGRGLLRDWQGSRDVLNAPSFFELAVPDDTGGSTWTHEKYMPNGVFISLGTNDFNLAQGDFPDSEEFTQAYVRFLRRIRAVYPATHIFLTEGPIVQDSPRDAKRVLRAHIEATVRRMNDTRIHAFWSNCYPGDASDLHPTADQHAMMARDFERPMREILGW